MTNKDIKRQDHIWGKSFFILQSWIKQAWIKFFSTVQKHAWIKFQKINK